MSGGLNFGMMPGVDNLFYQLGTGFAGIMAVVLIVFGVIQCYFGYKVFKVLMAITGFFVGAGLGGAIGTAILMDSFGGGGIVVVAALIGGIIGVTIALKVYFVGIFLYGLAIGLLIGVALSEEIVIGIVLGIITGVLLVIFDRLLIIISTAISGGSALGLGVSALIFSLGMPLNPAATALFSLLFIATGLYYQFKVNGGLPRAIKSGKKRKENEDGVVAQGNSNLASNVVSSVVAFCEECGTKLEIGSSFCSNCGSQNK